MLEIYPRLVESASEVRVYMRVLSAQYKGEIYVEKPEDREVPLADGYRLEKVRGVMRCYEIGSMNP